MFKHKVFHQSFSPILHSNQVLQNQFNQYLSTQNQNIHEQSSPPIPHSNQVLITFNKSLGNWYNQM